MVRGPLIAFELTTAIFWVEIHLKKCPLSAMATMDDYVSHFMSSKGACYLGKCKNSKR